MSRPQQKEYPKHFNHDDVKCPKCGRQLKGKAHMYGTLKDAKWAKFCNVPCYGVAWYSLIAYAQPEDIDYEYLIPTIGPMIP